MTHMASHCISLRNDGPTEATDVGTASGAFVALDELARDGGAGFTLVHGPALALPAVARHLARRGRALGRDVWLVDGRNCHEPWRALARSLGLSGSADAVSLAAALVRAAGAGLALVLVTTHTRWGSAVADEIARIQRDAPPRRGAMFVELSERRDCPYLPALMLTPEASPRDVEHWWSALLPTAFTEPCSFEQLEELELRWLGDDGASDGGASDGGASGGGASDSSDASSRPRDAWDLMIAAEFHASAGALEQACHAAREALDAAPDACARADLWLRWELAFHALSEHHAAEDLTDVMVAFAELAFAFNDSDAAQRMAELAAGQCPGRHDVLFALGRANAERGETPGARRAFERALELAVSPLARARVSAELAEVHAQSGECDDARLHAESALELTDDTQVCLSARNVLGKLLLVDARWSDAEQHFAADEVEASCSGNRSAVLRARLNRANALMAAGRRVEAAALLDAVLSQSRADGDPRGEAFALSNLASTAHAACDHDGELRLRELAIHAFRQVGNRSWLGREMVYLADVRLTLGLVDEAAEALAFARHAFSLTIQPRHAAWLSLVSAQIWFARGNTARAAADIDSAICSASSASDRSMLCQCLCFAARIAIEEGDIQRAESALAEACGHVSGPSMEAEIALVEARIARASGDAFAAIAARALVIARQARDHKRSAEAFELQQERQPALPVSPAPSPAAGSIVPDRPDLDDARPAHASRSIVGSHPSMRRLREMIAKVANHEVTVLIHGESGTGKELVADAIHAHSERRHKPIVRVNCAALVETLLLSELFGHEKGAFTGASRQRRGCFEVADGGTIFLDEIGDISAATQAALLRVMQDGSFHRVGGSEPVRSNVRIICATNRDLQAMVRAGEFREDLYYRLSGIVILAPPLRHRLSDLPLLASEILRRLGQRRGLLPRRLSAGALRTLAQHHWPGNVRELENALSAAALFCTGDTIFADEMARHVDGLAVDVDRDAGEPTRSEPRPTAPRQLGAPIEHGVYQAVRGGVTLRSLQKKLEHHCIVEALAETSGHITRAAALLGMKRPRLSQLIKEYAIDVDVFKTEVAQ
jgi:transcriptional regulator with GAF, ATPase, and Fis domain/tetratricopeptide (TPR) repeat protein